MTDHDKIELAKIALEQALENPLTREATILALKAIEPRVRAALYELARSDDAEIRRGAAETILKYHDWDEATES
jgi:hypothetical protein